MGPNGLQISALYEKLAISSIASVILCFAFLLLRKTVRPLYLKNINSVKNTLINTCRISERIKKWKK